MRREQWEAGLVVAAVYAVVGFLSWLFGHAIGWWEID